MTAAGRGATLAEAMDALRASLLAALVLAASAAAPGARAAAGQDSGGALGRLKQEAEAADLPDVAPPARTAPESCGTGLASACRRLAEALDPTAYPYPETPREREAEQARLRSATTGPVAALPPDRRGVLDDLRALGVSDVDLFHGSHLVIEDGGRRYAAWRALDAHPRVSSHYPDVHVQQYELRMPGLGVLLFGRTGDGSTWCQMEAHGADPADALLHVGDFVKHELEGGRNVGPDGMSPRTEASPLVLAAAP